MRDARYPGPDCLEPDEVERLAQTGKLPASRLAHASACEGCERLLAGIQPAPAVFAEILEEARQEAVLVVAESPPNDQGGWGTRVVVRTRRRFVGELAVVGTAAALIVGFGVLLTSRGVDPTQVEPASFAAVAVDPSMAQDTTLRSLSLELTKDMQLRLEEYQRVSTLYRAASREGRSSARTAPRSWSARGTGVGFSGEVMSLPRGVVWGELAREGADLRLNVAYIRPDSGGQVSWVSATVPPRDIRYAADSLTRHVLVTARASSWAASSAHRP